jgi:hypothetical protein
MKKRSFLAALPLLVLARCGGSTTTPSPDTGCPGSGPSNAGTLAAPPSHRAQATACSTPGPANCDIGDAGAGASCSNDSDCAAPDGSFTWYTFCLHGTCATDECITDSDCASNEVCNCASDSGYGGSVCHVNRCLPANCHVDADCGPGGFCTPSVGYCGGILGFYCHKPTDPCLDPSVDCHCPGLSVPACVYSPQGANWVCGEAAGCAG